MEEIDKLVKNIRTDTILFFDLDGTLVDTNFANYLSYLKAIKSVIPKADDLSYNQNERFNRASLKALFPSLTKAEYDKIILLKEASYYEHLPQTKLVNLVVDVLNQYFKTNQTVLVTNCREGRALSTLNYHNLSSKFSNIFCRKSSENSERTNKYKKAITNLNLAAQNIFAFENEKQEIEDAVLAGISIDKIICI